MQYPELKDWLITLTTNKKEFSASEIAKCIKDGINFINDTKIEYLLLKKDLAYLNEILLNLGFNLCGLDYENSLTLIIWWLYYDVVLTINYENRYFVATATDEVIISKFGENWKGTTNRASLIFSAYTGFLAPEYKDYTQTQRYAEILTYSNLDLIYKYLYDRGAFKSPIRQIAEAPKNPLEHIFNFDDVALYDWCIASEIIPFKFVNLGSDLNLEQIYTNLESEQWLQFKEILFSELKTYKSFEGLSDLQLVQKYKPPNVSNRTTLIRLITKKIQHWRLYDTPCTNSDVGIHIITLECRQHTLQNPILAFGDLQNYNYWNLDELEESFISNINFKYPDSTLCFTIAQINDLKQFLLDNKIGLTLLKVLENKLLEHAKITEKLKLLKTLYYSSSKLLFTKILLQLFYLGLYSRFWKGKTQDYPYEWKDLDEVIEEHNLREENVNKGLEELLNITDSSILAFLELIPRIQFNWTQIIPEFGEESIYEICKTTYKGNFCVSHFSNIILQTSYYILVKVLKVDLNQLLLGDGCKYKFIPEKMIDCYHRDPTLKLNKIQN